MSPIMISNNLRLFLHFHVSASAFKPFFDPLTWIKNHWQPMHCGMPGKRRVYSELVVVGQKKEWDLGVKSTSKESRQSTCIPTSLMIMDLYLSLIKINTYPRKNNENRDKTY